jgi:hypothetical protein
MNKISCRGAVRVALPPDEAIELFTPEGERTWVAGWDPTYPGGDDGVFVTDATTWVTVERSERVRRYARVTPGVQAGTVSVRCEPDGAGTVATVGYELTALGPDADLAAFAAGYADFMAGWERQIAARV